MHLYICVCMYVRTLVTKSYSLSSTRISNELGAGNPQAARLSTCVVMLISMTEIVFVITILFTARKILGYAYSKEKEVVNYVAQMVPLICLSVFMDGIQGVLGGNNLIFQFSGIFFDPLPVHRDFKF